MAEKGDNMDESSVRPPLFSVAVQSESRWYLDSIVRELASVVVEAETRAGQIVYDAGAAFDYARRFCGGGNTCGNEYDLDCTHFMCHCLAAGGIRIKAPSDPNNCPAGLNNAVRYLAEAFELMRANYSNVTRITFDDLTRLGRSEERRVGKECRS